MYTACNLRVYNAVWLLLETTSVYYIMLRQFVLRLSPAGASGDKIQYSS